MPEENPISTASRWETWTKQDYVFFCQMWRAMAVAYDAGCTDAETYSEIGALSCHVRNYEARMKIRAAYDGEIKQPSKHNAITEKDIPY